VGTDIDLVLVDATTSQAIWSSQSVTDSVEGFDVVIPQTGVYDLFWTYPEGARGCGGTGAEPFGLALAVGNF
jgi:hypothetical protein